MTLNNKLIDYINPELSESGSNLATYIERGYISDKINREDLIIIAEHLIRIANFTTRKTYKELTGKGKDAHYFKRQYKLLNEINLVEL